MPPAGEDVIVGGIATAGSSFLHDISAGRFLLVSRSPISP